MAWIIPSCGLYFLCPCFPVFLCLCLSLCLWWGGGVFLSFGLCNSLLCFPIYPSFCVGGGWWLGSSSPLVCLLFVLASCTLCYPLVFIFLYMMIVFIICCWWLLPMFMLYCFYSVMSVSSAVSSLFLRLVLFLIMSVFLFI